MSEPTFPPPGLPGLSPQRAEFELAVLRAIAGLVPGSLPARVRATIEVEGEGVVLRMVIPPERTLEAAAWPVPGRAPDARAAPAPQLSDMERDVLQAVREAGRELTGEEIAERAGYPWESDLRSTLAAMRRHGLLSGRPGERGYGPGPRA